MRYFNLLAGLAMAAGVALADGPHWADRDLHRDYRDLRNDHIRAQQLRADIARDRWQLDEALRCGRRWEAYRIQADLARDERALRALECDMRRDRADIRADRDDRYRDGRYYDGRYYDRH